MATVCITGGTGMVGRHLSRFLLQQGHRVLVLTRATGSFERNGIGFRHWNPSTQTVDPGAIAEADYIIHLAGAGVADKRWSNKRKAEIRESRTLGSQTLVQALRTIPNKVQAVMSASAIGWYGPDKGLVFTEEAPAAADFLGTTCSLWESSIAPVVELGIRLVRLRIGIVLSNDGGAFPAFRNPLRMGIAPILGSGQQIISWVHIHDLCRMFVFAMEQPQLTGVFNAVAPQPVSNKTMLLELAAQLRGKAFIPVPVPAIALRLLMGEMSVEVLKSCTVSSEKISKAGFQFNYPTLHTAVRELITAAAKQRQE